MKKTARFRRLIEAEEILIQPGVHDGFSARLCMEIASPGSQCHGRRGK